MPSFLIGIRESKLCETRMSLEIMWSWQQWKPDSKPYFPLLQNNRMLIKRRMRLPNSQKMARKPLDKHQKLTPINTQVTAGRSRRTSIHYFRTWTVGARNRETHLKYWKPLREMHPLGLLVVISKAERVLTRRGKHHDGRGKWNPLHRRQIPADGAED